MSRLVVKSRKQHIRLWFEFYKLAKSDVEYAANLTEVEAFYEPWGDVTGRKFDEWWEDHSHLFGESFVQEIIEIDEHPNSLNVSIPLNIPVSASLEQVKELIVSKQEARLTDLGVDKRRIKSSKIGFGNYELTPGVEIRGSTIHETLVLLQYWMDFGKPAINISLVERIRDRLKARPRAKWVPLFMIDENPDDPSNVIRQLRRRINRGKRICESVSRGDFPGKSILK